MRQMRKMGPLQNLVAMLPGVPKELRHAEVDEGELARIEAIICSMTPEERRHPSIIDGSRRLRIAQGSGTTTPGGQRAAQAVQDGLADDEVDDEGRARAEGQARSTACRQGPRRRSAPRPGIARVG